MTIHGCLSDLLFRLQPYEPSFAQWKDAMSRPKKLTLNAARGLTYRRKPHTVLQPLPVPTTTGIALGLPSQYTVLVGKRTNM